MQHDVVRLMVILGANLTLVYAFVHRSDVLYYQTPFIHSLVVVHANTSVWCERIQTNRQRMYLTVSFPCYLYTIQVKLLHQHTSYRQVHCVIGFSK